MKGVIAGMKITETITRECCDVHKDLAAYKGERLPAFPSGKNPLFCRHCGQLWWITQKPGEMDAGLERIEIKDWD